MKNHIIFIALIVSLSACSEKLVLENPSLIGDWNLTATYADPGDGSGKWNDVMITVIQKITFKANGDFSKETIQGFNYKSYQINNDTITFNDFEGKTLNMRFTIEDNMLTLYPPCIEGCGFRFKKMNN